VNAALGEDRRREMTIPFDATITSATQHGVALDFDRLEALLLAAPSGGIS
jgi:hypothetical protein